MIAKYKALDIANLYVELANSLPNDSIDNLKLNKLCYFAQAWAETKLGYKLFPEEVEAWHHGPVVPSVYHAFKICGKRPIEEPTYHFDESVLTSDELSLLTDVYMTYGKYTSWSLANKTHAPDSPWTEVYVEGQNNPIKDCSMINYCHTSNELETLQLNLSKENIIEYA